MENTIQDQVYSMVSIRANKLASDTYKAEKKKHKGNARKIYPLTHCQELKDLQIFLCELCVCSVARAEEIASIVTTGEHQKNWLK